MVKRIIRFGIRTCRLKLIRLWLRPKKKARSMDQYHNAWHMLVSNQSLICWPGANNQMQCAPEEKDARDLLYGLCSGNEDCLKLIWSNLMRFPINKIYLVLQTCRM
jgi:hypothetical protein